MAPSVSGFDSGLFAEDVHMGCACEFAERLCSLAVNIVVRGPAVGHNVESVHNVAAGGVLRQAMRLGKLFSIAILRSYLMHA